MDKVDAMRQNDAQRPWPKHCYLYRHIATAFLLGHILGAFLCELPSLLHGYLAAVLSCERTPSFHAGHGNDCKRLLSGGCCVVDHDRAAVGLLDPKGLYAYPST